MWKLSKTALWTMISTQLLTWTPAVAQSFNEKKEDLLEVFADNNLLNQELNTLLLNNRISYFTKHETKVYSSPDSIHELFIIPEGIYLKEYQIDESLSTNELLCYSIAWKNVWIKKNDLSPNNESVINKYLKPTTEKIIVVDKKWRRMKIYDQYWKNLVKEFIIALSPTENWDKTIEWDENTPEGKYYICFKKPVSEYWKNPKTWGRLWSLQVSYPNIQDAVEWLIAWDISTEEFHWINNSIQKKQIPNQSTALWNHIMIHWGWSDEDWTLWCIWLDNKDMFWLYNFIDRESEIFIR